MSEPIIMLVGNKINQMNDSLLSNLLTLLRNEFEFTLHDQNQDHHLFSIILKTINS